MSDNSAVRPIIIPKVYERPFMFVSGDMDVQPNEAASRALSSAQTVQLKAGDLLAEYKSEHKVLRFRASVEGRYTRLKPFYLDGHVCIGYIESESDASHYSTKVTLKTPEPKVFIELAAIVCVFAYVMFSQLSNAQKFDDLISEAHKTVEHYETLFDKQVSESSALRRTYEANLKSASKDLTPEMQAYYQEKYGLKKQASGSE